MHLLLAGLIFFSSLLGFAVGVMHCNLEAGELTGRTFEQMYADHKQCESKLSLRSESCIFVLSQEVVDNVK